MEQFSCTPGTSATFITWQTSAGQKGCTFFVWLFQNVKGYYCKLLKMADAPTHSLLLQTFVTNSMNQILSFKANQHFFSLFWTVKSSRKPVPFLLITCPCMLKKISGKNPPGRWTSRWWQWVYLPSPMCNRMCSHGMWMHLCFPSPQKWSNLPVTEMHQSCGSQGKKQDSHIFLT